MDKYKAKLLYISQEGKTVQLLNTALFLFFYFLMFVVVYQFVNRESKNRTWKSYIILVLLFLYPYIIYPFQTSIYSILRFIFLSFISIFYYNDN
jgi:hypothetical protein